MLLQVEKSNNNESIEIEQLEAGVNDNVINKASNKINVRPHKQNVLRKEQYCCSNIGCSKIFGKLSRLIVHERTHTGERPFKCEADGCDKSYTRKFHLTRHFNVSHKCQVTESKETVCDKCLKSFSNIHSLKKHISNVHNKKYVCKDCGLAFRKQHTLTEHAYVHTGVEPYRCNFENCSSEFLSMSLFKRHEKSHYTQYNCTECELKFETHNLLRKHLKKHPKVCQICRKEFNMMSKLRRHLTTHEKYREAYFCSYTPCEKYYFEEKNLKFHILSSHDENFKGFQCKTCDKWLVTKQKREYHIKSIHKEPVIKKKTTTQKPRKIRKDKGTIKRNMAEYLSGFKRTDCLENEVKKLVLSI